MFIVGHGWATPETHYGSTLSSRFQIWHDGPVLGVDP